MEAERTKLVSEAEKLYQLYLQSALPPSSTAVNTTSALPPSPTAAVIDDDDTYVPSGAMLQVVKVVSETAETETARLNDEDAMDAIDFLRDRLLELQSKYRDLHNPER